MTTDFISKEDLSLIDIQSQAFIQKFESEDILISGASGFVGQWLTNSILALHERGLLNGKLHLISRNSSNLRKQLQNSDLKLSKVKIIESDLGSGNFIARKDQSTYGLIFHCATPAASLSSEMTEKEILAPATLGLEEIIDSACSRDGSTILINLSSGAVYGNSSRNKTVICENLKTISSFNEESAYTKAKVLSEELIIEAVNKGRILGCNPRLFAFAGPGIPLNTKFAVGDFVNAALNKKLIRIEGSPFTTRSYLYPAELVVLLLRTAVSPTLSNLHIGSNQALTMIEIASIVDEVFEGVGMGLSGTSLSPNHYVPEIDKTIEHLGYQPVIQIEEALVRWKEWIKCHDQLYTQKL